MSLVSDFGHYYINTWIALQEGGINYPLQIINVDQRGRYSRNDYSHEAEQALYFVAIKCSKDENGRFVSEQIEVDVFDERLILESPDVGYLKHGRNIVSWTHINPVRQRAKGLMGNKIRSLNQPRGITGEMVYNLFNPDFEGLVNRFIFINPSDNNVYYKGAHVGVVDIQAERFRGRQRLNLLDKFKHIAEDLSAYNVNLVETL